ncbi:MAG TPA: holo-ACP synthase [Candidatus Limnocylindrales bacterium]|jgi:holo-[acyl-carrier protein] synthase|nr:holo-ACP synthase [Candidatus Limnocylindrales bacterium]
MPIRAVGLDLVGVESFAEQLGSVGSAFAERTFTVGELRAAGGHSGAAQHLAGRYAAKEAFVKAFSGARPGRAPAIPDMDWRQVEVVPDAWGRPTLVLHGELAAAVAATLGEVALHVSITHEPTMAAAVVILEGS